MSNRQVFVGETEIQLQPQQITFVPGPATTSNVTYSYKHSRKWFLGLGVSEVVVGIICIILGIVLIVQENKNFSYTPIDSHGYLQSQDSDDSINTNVYSFEDSVNSNVYSTYFRVAYTFGEGIWGGFIIIVVGVLGIFSSRPKSNNTLIAVHLGFSILGTLVAFVVHVISWRNFSLVLFNQWEGLRVITLLSFFSLVAMSLQIASASFCGAFVGCCKISRLQFVYPGQIPYNQMVMPNSAIQETFHGEFHDDFA